MHGHSRGVKLRITLIKWLASFRPDNEAQSQRALWGKGFVYADKKN